MLGNCATGRPAIVTAPTITSDDGNHHRHDRTIDEEFGHDSIARRLRGCDRDLDGHAIPDLLHALNHNPLTTFQALFNNPH